MDEYEISAGTPQSFFFESWLTRWRITVLDPQAAVMVLADLLQGHAQFQTSHPFWITVESYLSSRTQESAAPICVANDPATLTVVLRRLLQLDAQSAKKLLMQMIAPGNLTMNHAAFWRMASDSVSRCEQVSVSQSTRNHRSQ